MRHIFRPEADSYDFLARATQEGYSMEEELVEPELCAGVSRELEREGFLKDLVELEPTSEFRKRGMLRAHFLHSALNGMIGRITGDKDSEHLPLFSVRVFEPGEYSTTIHRNHPSIGPWAVGVTLRGNAPFNVYRQEQLPRNEVLPLRGDGNDPEPLERIETQPGAGWVLYTENELVPHSGGIVRSDHQRELLILYGTEWTHYNPRS